MFDTADESHSRNGIILPLKNMVNEAYSLDIGKKIRAQAHQAMLDGDYIGARAPFGYKKAPDNCHKLIIDEETAPTVRQIFEWAAEGDGLNTITVRLNDMGITTSSVYKSRTSERDKHYHLNKIWTTFTVAFILENPVYTGDMVQGKSTAIEHKQHITNPEDYIVVQNTHEPIVSRELFEKVQKIRAAVREEYKSKPIDPYTENIFKGKIFCPHCGKPLHRQRAKRKTMPDIYRIHCLSPSRVSKTACIGVNIDESVVIEFVSAAVRDKLSTLGKTFARTVKADSAVSALKKEKTSKQRELERVQSLIRGLYESLVGGVISSEDYEEFKTGYAKQADDLKQAIELLNSEISILEHKQKQRDEIEGFADSFKHNEQLTADLIAHLIERIEISHEREINIVFRPEIKG